MFSLLSLPGGFLVALVATFTLAQYTVDDTNSTIQYIPNGMGGLQWHTALSPEINLTASFDQTTTVGECNASQDCHLKIPFVGSGITIYVVQVNFAGINVSVTVDTLLPAIRTFLEPKFYQHNFPLFDIQGLTSGSHTVDVALLDCQYNSSNLFAYYNGTSALAFDYAIINDQQIVSTSTPGTSSRAGKSIPIGAIVGGVVAGLVAIGAFILLLLCSRRRTKLRNSNLIRRNTEIDPEPRVAPLMQSIPYPPAEVRPPSHTLLFAPSTAFNPEALYGDPSTPSTVQFGHTQSTVPGHNISIITPSITAPDPSERFSANSSVITRSPTGSPSPSSGAETRPLLPAATSRLTGQQLDLIHNLYSLNVPAADIAGVMERMRVERELAAGDAGMSLMRRDSQTSEVLPSYE